ncbi:LLM class flavin-dependent oxidoreductase, partial [Streptomyces sp. SID10244]|nr:LLM class flavin-dependent oxidoreductase [Streptomyces sp. SID10244]
EGNTPSLDGTWYQVREALNVPAPLSKIPVMIGGGGERKTLRMVAQYADESNLICAFEDIGRKLDALSGHCDRLGRNRSEITVSLQTSACIAPTHDEAVAEFESYLERNPAAEVRRANTIVGDPDEVGARFSELLATGVDGITVNAPANGH